MSDLSTLSHEYESNALFADEINTLILRLKKFVLKTKGKANISIGEIDRIRKKLIEFLEGILVELNPGSLESETSQKRIGLIPMEVVEKIRSQYRNTLDYFIGDVKELIKSLKSNEQIDPKGLELLDKMCDAADSITSTSFRRLWRR